MKVLAALAGLVFALAGCPATKGPVRSTCRTCVADLDCTSERCVQLEADAVCARACASDRDCTSDDHCVPVVTAEGAKVSACLARDGSCGALPDDPVDAGTPATDCARYLTANVSGTCCRCSSSTGSCAPNNCYNGYACDAEACRCTALPHECAAPNDAMHAGGAVTANVTKSGGTMSRLHFAVVGDTRPATVNDTAGYPLATVRSIFTALTSLNPSPAFVVATGDFVFATPDSNAAGPQLDVYLQGRASFPGPLFAAMGNHECNGYTYSNCGPRLAQGQTSNYTSFVSKMMGPIGETKPYYARRVDAADGSWTAKFVIIAANSWSNTQATWLETALSDATTYTFLVRHEPTGGNATGSDPAPGVAPSETIIKRHPLTLELEGHAHTWLHPSETPKELIVGNGGAPLSTSVPYGYTVLSQRADGAIVVTGYALSDGRALSTFAVQADGSPATN